MSAAAGRLSAAAALGACALALLAAAPAAAQGWPDRPLRLLIGLPAGSGADIVARVVATPLGERLGRPVVVDNRPGAAENIAMEAVARSAPDGYTLLFALTSLVTNPHLYRLAFDPLKDLTPVTQVATAHYVLVVRPALAAASVAELVALARSQTTPLTCAHSSGALHLACAWFRSAAAVDMTLVPYKGSVQALNDVMAERADMTFAVVHTAVAPAKAGRVRTLATTAARRGSGPFPALPVMAETVPGLALVTWLGVMAPSGTPAEIIGRLNREIGQILEQPEVKSRIEGGGLEVAHGTPAQLADLIRRDYERYGEVIRRTGIRAE